MGGLIGQSRSWRSARASEVKEISLPALEW